MRAGALALRVIDTVDPSSQTSLELSASLSPEQVNGLSLNEALAVAAQLGIEVPTPPIGLPRADTTPAEPLNQAI
jgi:hypothetical protein